MTNSLEHLYYRTRWISPDGPPDLKKLFAKVPRQHAGGSGETVVSTAPDPGGSSDPSRRDGKDLKILGNKRQGDDRDRYPSGEGPRSSESRFHLRSASTMAYAIYKFDFQRRYVGYSGGASDIANGFVSTGDRDRRMRRVRPVMGDTEQLEQWTIENCAEVAALSLAVFFQEQVQDLFFIAFNPNGTLKDPCNNCIQWINDRSFGWFTHNGAWHPGNAHG